MAESTTKKRTTAAKPAPKKTAARKPAASKPAAKKPAVRKPAAKKPATQKPARTRRSPKVRAVEQVAESYFDAVTRRDVDAMADHWHPDGVDDLVPIGVLRGPAGVKEFFTELFGAMPDFAFTVERIVPDDRFAAVQWRATGTFTGSPFQGLQATGRRVELRGTDVAEIEEGKLIRNTAYYDGAGFARAIGMLPPEDSGAERAMKAGFNALTRARQTVKKVRSS